MLTDVTLGEPFELQVGEVAVLRDQQLSIRFLSVLEDSRCPTGSLILCIWAGRVRLRLAVAPLSGDEAFVELHFGDYTAQLVLTAVR